MDIVFTCEKCSQTLEVDATASGSEIECPTCNNPLVVPAPDPTNIHMAPTPAQVAAKQHKHFEVPVTDKPTESLIQKAARPLEVAAKDDERRMRIRTIKHSDCMEVGKDRFDDVVSEFLNKVGEEHVISIDHITYTNRDMSSGELMSDYGVLIVFRG